MGGTFILPHQAALVLKPDDRAQRRDLEPDDLNLHNVIEPDDLDLGQAGGGAQPSRWRCSTKQVVALDLGTGLLPQISARRA
jgi:hypothetical protein